MMRHAWKSYKTHAWGSNELRPLSKRGHQPSVLGRAPLGATIVDSIDTLYLMGLDEEYKDAKKWIEESLNFNVVCPYYLPAVIAAFLFASLFFLALIISGSLVTRERKEDKPYFENIIPKFSIKNVLH
ncbi:unnamed protein product [Dibothriocephalus latus]|uniref:alpha-1,2-Mannosidase n=1 Tax=Dibothriocephalus latus TaxID=60516 RepID=A0A3P7P5D2_DIBLA|nr:unnamed protein product [Dibothriocephalus latus]